MPLPHYAVYERLEIHALAFVLHPPAHHHSPAKLKHQRR